ncbi:hypothetical protein GJU39_14960 [Pedobacter petrophilus]|uniref:Bacteriocin n=1 Tax=Pedobacter petrophilus TaxID=1908241 RepID=A0A7K0G0S4_9SPHI|nr:hypothetical protein [Pedobacter petrophilus]MRX77385.1 hypothetical protein [Pedobacter petrophilus]
MKNIENLNLILLDKRECEQVNGGNSFFWVLGYVHQSVKNLVDWVYDPNNDQ